MNSLKSSSVTTNFNHMNVTIDVNTQQRNKNRTLQDLH